MTLIRKQAILGMCFILPWAIGFLCFFGYNLVQTIIYSLSELELNTGGGFQLTFVGLQNYRVALTEHATFVRTLSESLWKIIVDVPLITFFSLFIAILLNRRFKGRAFVRAIFFLPVIMATAAIGEALASNLQNIMGGLTNTTGPTQVVGLNATVIAMTLSDFGIPVFMINYLVDVVGRLYDIIKSSGVQILIFLAALQSVSPALYEVAKIEGATAYEAFWKITFPMVSPLILTNVIYTIVDLFSQSEIVEVAHVTAFTNLNFGLSATMSLVSSMAICIVLAIAGFAISRLVFYQG